MNYNASTDALVGDKLMVFVNDGTETLPIAFGTTCGINITADTLDTSNKMSGNWKEYLVGQLGYTVNSGSLMSMKEGQLSFKTLKKMMVNRVPLPFVMAKTIRTAEGDFTKDEEYVKGMGIITSLEMSADNGSICTSSVTFQGTGELEDGDTGTP